MAPTNQVETLIFGMHFILLVTCVRILLRRPRRRRVQIAMLLVVSVMFICSAADIAFTWNVGINHATVLLQGDTMQLYHLTYPKIILFHVNAILADILLIIRCFVVWGRWKLVLYVESVIFTAIVVLGIYAECATTASGRALIVYYVVAIAAFNLVVTVMTASRIYWVARQARILMGSKLVSRHHFAVGIVVESGLLYTISSILAVGLGQTNHALLGSAISSRVIAMVPIFIIIRVAMGQAVQDVETTVAMMRGRDTTIPFPQSEVANEVIEVSNNTDQQQNTGMDHRTHV